MLTTAATEQIRNKLLDRNMEELPSQPDVSLTPESAQLEMILRKGRTVGEDQEESPVTSGVDWVSSEDFTVEEGERQIGEYIRTWELPARWLHSMYFLCTTEEQHITFHHYQARFSAPTPARPIQGTVSVFFTVRESKVEARDQPVEVGFLVESQTLVQTPGATTFTEKWLADVIESKAGLRHATDAPWSAPRATSSYRGLAKTNTLIKWLGLASCHSFWIVSLTFTAPSNVSELPSGFPASVSMDRHVLD